MELPNDFALEERHSEFVTGVYIYTIKLRVLFLLKKWLEEFSEEILSEPQIMEELNSFIISETKSAGLEAIVESIHSLFLKVVLK